MREFIGDPDLRGALFVDCDLTGARMRNVGLSGASITDAMLVGTTISGDVRGLTINGVEVAPYIDAELDRRHPERLRLRASDLAGVRSAFAFVDELWAPTIDRARRLSADLLHARVENEFSFVETLRHLVFATDAWLTRMVLRVPHGYHPWGVPPDLPLDAPPDTGPDLDEVLAVRAERRGALTAWLREATDEALTIPLDPPDQDGHPQGRHRPVDCFRVVLDEEWWHHQYATRDLAVLEPR